MLDWLFISVRKFFERLSYLWGLSAPADVEYMFFDPRAKFPTRAHADDAALDLYSCEYHLVQPGKIVNIETGLAFSVPRGYYVTINGRSGLNKRGIIVTRGVIDSGYVGTMKVLLHNVGQEPYEVEPGNRIAQLTLHRCIGIKARQVKTWSSTHSTRGTAGFGSSGS